jgi:muramoyltetrapeptide carboxypeptidase LdcA involved in peptidoglycan recycling
MIVAGTVTEKMAPLMLRLYEQMPEPKYVEYWLRNYGSQGILQKVNAIIFGKPYQEKYYNEYKDSIMAVVTELKFQELPIVYNMTFGHNEPMMCLPFGAMAEVDCDKKTFSILEAGVE